MTQGAIFLTTLQQQRAKGDIVKLPDGAAALIGEASMGDEEPVLSAKHYQTKNKKDKKNKHEAEQQKNDTTKRILESSSHTFFPKPWASSSRRSHAENLQNNNR